MSAAIRWLGVTTRRLGDAKAATGAVIALVVATSFLFGVAPRLAEKQAGDALRTTVRSATPDTRSLIVQQTGRLGEGNDPLAIVRATGVQFEESFPAHVDELVPTSYLVFDTPRFIPFGLEFRTLRLRYQDEAANHVTLVSGRFPTGRVSSLATPDGLPADTTALNRPLEARPELVSFEVAVSVDTASNLGVKVGDSLALSTDQSDRLTGWSVADLAVQIVGIFRTNDANADYWFADTSLDHPQVRSVNANTQIDDMTALVAAEAYPALLGATADSGLPLRYSFRYPVDASRLTANGVAALLPDLRRMESVFLAMSSGRSGSGLQQPGGNGPITLQTGLAGLVEDYVTSWRSVAETLSVVETGGGAVAMLALGLICLVAGRRRAASTRLWLSRGAARRQLWMGLLAEAILVVVPAAILGAVLAIAAIPTAPLEPTFVASGAVLLAALALLLWDGRAAARDPAGSGNSTALAMGSRSRAAEGGRGIAALTRGASPRRLVTELMIVAGAIGGAYLLRQRGVGAAGSDAALTSPDFVIAAIPVLIGGAAALVAVRLLPLPLDVLSRLAERSRGLVAVLALRRATRRSNDRLLLTALLTMAAVWSFAIASLSYMDRSAAAASWQEVGADYRVALQEGTLGSDLTLNEVPGVEKLAYAAQLPGHVINQGLQIQILALDIGDYRAVAVGGWPETLIPERMGGRAGVDVVVSTAFAEEEKLGIGASVKVVLGGGFVDMSIVAVEDSFPTLDTGTMWIVADRSQIAGVLGDATKLTPTETFIRAGASVAPALTAAARYQLPGRLLLTNRYDSEARLRRSAGFSSTVFGLWVVTIAVAIYGILAILAALLLAGAERSREAAHLHILGLTRREEAGLVALEHGPTAILMIAAGVGLGLALFEFLLPSLGLGSLVGGQVTLGLSIEPLEVAVVAAAVLVVVGAAVALEALTASIIEPAAALRKGLD